MFLSPAALAQLCALDRAEYFENPADSIAALREMARQTPAWLERYACILDRIIDQQGAVEDVADFAGIAVCPQVVGLDFPTMALTRAEWVDGSLHLRLAPLCIDAKRRTTFRIVGAEPRVWWVGGVQDVSIEHTAKAIILSVPMVEADMELAPGSY